MKKEQVVQFFIEADKPLTQQMIDTIESGLDYAVFTAVCRICSHQEIVIAPTISGFNDMECGNCGNMSVEPAMPDEELEEYQMDNFNQNRLFVR
jgi:hypothetical protein